MYRKTTPSAYPTLPTSNFTDTSKNWRQLKNVYRRTSDNETASLTDVPGRYTDDTRSWRRIKAMYRFTGSSWQKIFAKFGGQPYPEIDAFIRYNSYTGTDVGQFAMMGPGADSIAQGASGTTYLWGRDGASWQNDTPLANRLRTFVFASTPLPDTAGQVLDDEGFNEGDKLANTQAVIANYDGKYLWYKDRITLTNGSSGTSYSQTVRVIKQRPVINSLAFKTDNTVTPGELKYVSASVANQWYRSVNQATSVFKWYILDSQYETPTESKLYGTTSFTSVVLTETTSTLTMEDYFTIPTTFGGVSTVGKWLHVKLICKNSSSDNDADYSLAPYSDVTDQVIAQIGVGIPSFTYTISNVSSVTTPSAPTQTRVSSTSNDILFEFASSIPSDTLNYTLNLSGPVTNAGNNSLNVLNIFSNNSDYQTTLTSTASNSAVSSYVVANGNTRSYQANVSATTGAQSWKVNYTYTIGALSETGDVLTNVMPVKIIDIPGSTNPIVRINSVTAYSGLNQTGTAKTGTAGATTSLNISRPTATSSTSTSNYTFYSNLQATGSQRRVTLPAVFNSGTTIYVSTNGYINWGGSGNQTDPLGSLTIPSTSTSGITVAPLNGDLRQGSTVSSSNTSPGGLWYFADSTNFWVTWWGNYYLDATQYARYQIKFYWNQSYADVYIVNNSLTAITPSTTAVQNNLSKYLDWSATTLQTSTLLETATMNRVDTQDGQDDARTVIVASPPVLTWTVTWDAAGGESGTQFTTQPRGNSHTAPSPGPRNGFDLLYYRSGSGQSAVYVASGGTYTPTASVTFNAIWTAKTYTVSYNANLGTGAPSNQTKTHDVTLTLSSTAPTRATVGSTSYAFNGWNTASDGTGTNYSAGGSYTANAAVTLYAKWTATTVSTKLGTPTGVTATTTRTDGINITWNKVTGADYYGVWYRGSAPVYNDAPDFGGPNNPSVIPNPATGTTASYLDTSVSSGVTRSYDVQAFKSGNAAGTKSDWGGPATGTRASASATPATAPGIPGTPTNGWTSGLSYPFSWTAATPGTVSGGGAATISSYQIKIYRASDSAGTGAALYNTYTSSGSGTTYTFAAPDALYYAASVSATNSAALSSSSYSGISLYK